MIIDDAAFMGYIFETEGISDTRLGKLNKVVKILCDNPYSTDAFEQANIDIETVTEKELKYIERGVNKYI